MQIIFRNDAVFFDIIRARRGKSENKVNGERTSVYFRHDLCLSPKARADTNMKKAWS